MGVSLPLLGLLGEPGEGDGVGHVQLEEEEEGVVTNKLAHVRFLLLLRPERTDVELFVELGLVGEALHPAPSLLEGLPGPRWPWR